MAADLVAVAGGTMIHNVVAGSVIYNALVVIVVVAGSVIYNALVVIVVVAGSMLPDVFAAAAASAVYQVVADTRVGAWPGLRILFPFEIVLLLLLLLLMLLLLWLLLWLLLLWIEDCNLQTRLEKRYLVF